MEKLNVAVVGATGLVGRKILQILEERNFPINKLRAFASEKSAGSKINFKNENITVEKLDENSFSNGDIDIALFSAGGSVSEK